MRKLPTRQTKRPGLRENQEGDNMSDPLDYWERCFKEIDSETYDSSNIKTIGKALYLKKIINLYQYYHIAVGFNK